MSLASQRLHTGVEGVTPIVYTVRERRRGRPSLRDLLTVLRVECWCARCAMPDGSRLDWPSYYVGSVGRSYECWLEGNDLYAGRRYPMYRGTSTTSSPSAAAVAQLELRGLRLARVRITRNRADEADAARARAQAQREGWVEVAPGKWEKRGGEVSGGGDEITAGPKVNC